MVIMNDELDDINWNEEKTFLNLLKPKHHGSIVWENNNN